MEDAAKMSCRPFLKTVTEHSAKWQSATLRILVAGPHFIQLYLSRQNVPVVYTFCWRQLRTVCQRMLGTVSSGQRTLAVQ